MAKKGKKPTKAVLTITEKRGGEFAFNLQFIPMADANGHHPAGQIAMEAMNLVIKKMKKHGGPR